jgi:hypothetical protein
MKDSRGPGFKGSSIAETSNELWVTSNVCITRYLSIVTRYCFTLPLEPLHPCLPTGRLESVDTNL